jgi:hypothetical protein
MALLFANNSSLSNITALPSSISGGGLNLIKTQTASASSSISFVNGVDGVVLDGTYKEYIFKFINIHPSVDGAQFLFNGSTDGGSSYNVTKTSSFFTCYHREDDTVTALAYEDVYDLAQSTSYQIINGNIGSDNDESGIAIMSLFAPSSTTYVKHYIATTQHSTSNTPPYAHNDFFAGYFNTTSAINAIDFKFSSGNIDDGIIKMYGLVKS